ncbi:hypothetical protein RJ55_05602 [Drechmeria coniospora]|nr:hypothetical protein RJ55_05602 [Drechmeria coniospora]
MVTDYICNWFGGEAVSLRIAEQAGGDYAIHFRASGYAAIKVNETYTGGEVRQYGNLSFSRIFQASHHTHQDQPETAFQIFTRIAMGKSISTGKSVALHSFNTTGPLKSTKKDSLPTMPRPTCYIRAHRYSCDPDIWSLGLDGGSIVINGNLYEKFEDWPLAARQPRAAANSSVAKWKPNLRRSILTAMTVCWAAFM